MGLFVKSPNKEEKVKKDLLRYHKTKEIIDSNYSIKMGERLQSAMGLDQIEKIMELSYT